MFSKIKQFSKIELIKTSFFTSIYVFIRILIVFLINKIVAINLGSIGIAMVGQFTNFIGVVNSISTGGINLGIVKYVAENKNQLKKKYKIIFTSFIIILIFSFSVSLYLFICADFLAIKFLKLIEYNYVFKILSISIFFTAFNSMFLSILNGLKEIKKITIINISSSLLTLSLTILLVIYYKLSGVLIAIILGQSLSFFITFILIMKCRWIKLKYCLFWFDLIVLKKMMHYSMMTMSAAVCGPLALMIIRNYIGENLSWEKAGYWQGVWSISEVYLMMITSTLSVYYLPKLSEIHNDKELKNEIFTTAKIVLPIVAFIALCIFFLKNTIIKLLFSIDFMAMSSLFKFQLIGDVIKIACWLLAYQMVAKRMTKLFVFSELFFSLTFVLLSIYFIRFFGIEGVSIAFCLNSIAYLFYLIIIFKKKT